VSVVNCRVKICGALISQNLPDCTPPPPSWVLHQYKSNGFYVYFKSIFLLCNTSLSCQNERNNFYYICGEVVLKSQRKPLSQLVRNLMNRVLSVRSEIKLILGSEDWLQLLFKDFGRLVERCPQINAFFASNGVTWAPRPLGRLLLYGQDQWFLPIFSA
jgi:hypothetical protein